jgi:hypothetical protein
MHQVGGATERKWAVRRSGVRQRLKLALAALTSAWVFANTRHQRRAAMATLPNEGLRRSALTVVDALQGAGEQRSEYWRNRAKSFIEQIWPQDEDRRSPAISEAFARMSIASGDAFPVAPDDLRAPRSAVCRGALDGDLQQEG